ncbi:MAG: hypothetical protein AB8B97_09590 [Granulosicoccus sp.]
MWSEETLYTGHSDYIKAFDTLSANPKGGFANSIPDTDPTSLSTEELLAWSSVHGLAHLFVNGPVAKGKTSKA